MALRMVAVCKDLDSVWIWFYKEVAPTALAMIPSFGEQIWRNIESQIPWVASFNKWLRLSQLPNFTGPTLLISSDYGGQGKQSKFDVFSILVADLNKSVKWEIQRRQLRQHYLKDGRRMAFKNLNDTQRRNALIPFLLAANEIHGVCLVIAIHKNIKTLFRPEFLELSKANGILRSEWRFKSFERMLRIVHFISLLVGGLAKPNQNIYWISDRDEMFDGADRIADTQKMLSAFVSMYAKFPLGELGVGTTALDEGDRQEEDLSAVTDLVAGSVADLLTKLHSSTGGKVSGLLAKTIPESLSKKSEVLVSWLEDESGQLKKVKLCFDNHGDTQFFLGPFRTLWS